MTESAPGKALLAESRKVLIVMLSAIGDAVHVLPLLHAFKAHRADLEITWVIQPVPRELVVGQPVERFVEFRRAKGVRLASALWNCGRDLRASHFDLAIGLQVYLKAGLLLGTSGARVRLGFDRRRARDGQWLFSTHRIPERPSAHVQDQYFEFLNYLGVPHGPPVWDLTLSDTEMEARSGYFRRFNRPVCGMVVGTSRREKNWYPAHYARVIEALDVDFGMDTLLLGGPSVVEQEMARQIIENTATPVTSALGPGVRRLLWLLSGCDLVISPDTGPLHMARALDVPVVGLYGFTNPQRTGPYRKYTDLVVDGFALSAGENYSMDTPNRPEGMKRVKVADVLAKVDLARRRYPGPAVPSQP